MLDLETKTGYSKVYFLLGAAFTLSGALFLVGGARLISGLVGFVYPAYASFKAVESTSVDDDHQWLTYWVVFSTFTIFEDCFSLIVQCIPFYFFFKCAMLIWLYHPVSQGAKQVYCGLLGPLLKPYLSQIDVAKKAD